MSNAISKASVNFDYVADSYDNTRGFPEIEVPHISHLIQKIAQISSEQLILEVGIGTGRIALPLAQVTHTPIIGVDISQKMLEILTEKRHTEPVYPAIADATQLPLSPNSVDIIVTVHIFHLIPETQKLLNEMQRVLHPAGVLVYGWDTLENKESIWEILRAEFLPTYKDIINPSHWKRPDALKAYGWNATGLHLSHSYQRSYKPLWILEQIEQRQWTIVKNLSSKDLPKAIELAKTYLESKYGNLHQFINAEASFHLCTYTAPV